MLLPLPGLLLLLVSPCKQSALNHRPAALCTHVVSAYIASSARAATKVSVFRAAFGSNSIIGRDLGWIALNTNMARPTFLLASLGRMLLRATPAAG